MLLKGRGWRLYSTGTAKGRAKDIGTALFTLQPGLASVVAPRTRLDQGSPHHLSSPLSRKLSTMRDLLPSKYWTSVNCLPNAGRKRGATFSSANPHNQVVDGGIVTTCAVILAAPFGTSSVLELNSNYRREWKIHSTKLTPIKRHRRVVLIDENGKNLGDVESKIALGLAEGHGLTVTEVKDSGLGGKLPVFKMISKRELSENEKATRALARQKKKEEQFKEFKLGTRITDHDLEIKMKNICSVLTSGITVRVTVETRRRKGMSAEMFEVELERRGVMLEGITKRLKDVATRTSKKPNKVKKEAVAAEYKPIGPPAEGGESVPVLERVPEPGPEEGVAPVSQGVESEPVESEEVETSLSEPRSVSEGATEGAEEVSPLTRGS